MQMINSDILPLLGVFALGIFWLIGAREIPQILCSSIGTGILSAKRAIIISSVFGFAGIILSGHHVSLSYQKIIFFNTLASHETNFFRVILTFTGTVFIWIFIAKRMSYLVSHTHTVLSSLVGSFLISYGYQSINWYLISKIVTSWLVSPIICFFLALFFYSILRRSIIEKQNPVLAARKIGPAAVFIFVVTFCLMIFYNGTALIDVGATPLLVLSFSLGAALYLASIYSVRNPALEAAFEKKILESNAEKVFYPLVPIIVFMLPFSLGANDIANGVGPLLIGLQMSELAQPSTFHIPVPWILLFGGGVVLIAFLLVGAHTVQGMSR